MLAASTASAQPVKKQPIFHEVLDPLRAQDINAVISGLNELAPQARKVNDLTPILDSEQIKKVLQIYDSWAEACRAARAHATQIGIDIDNLQLADTGKNLMRQKLDQVIGPLLDNPFEIPTTPPHIEDDNQTSIVEHEPASASASQSTEPTA